MRYKRYPNRRNKRPTKRRKSGQRLTRIERVRTTVAFLIVAAIIAYGIHIASGLPSLGQLNHPKPEFASKVYSADGVLIGQYSVINRSRITFDEIPSHLINALIASEDRKFYNHRGIDIDRIIKATVKNILSFRIREGASTITQQVARNLYLSHEQSVTRKLREIITALQIERRFSKEDILELYFNLAFFGNGAYGVATAAERYFDKSVSQLTLTEAALLVGILPNPTLYDPFTHLDRALTRRNIVLNSMASMGYLSSEVARMASARPIELTQKISPVDSDIAPDFVEYVRRQVSALAVEYGFDIYRDGLAIHTTLDSRMQRHANRAVAGHINRLQTIFDRRWTWDSQTAQSALRSALEREVRNHPAYRRAATNEEREEIRTRLLTDDQFTENVKHQVKTLQTGFVAIDPTSGYIKAMVGGSDSQRNRYGLNRVTQIRRQPGSAFKPFVYTVAIENGYSPAYELPNEPITITANDGSLWRPANADGSVGGTASLREGLAYSINLIAVRTMLDLAPIEQIIRCAERMGITSHLHPYESLSLGTAEVSPLELTAAYGAYATNGTYAKPLSITRIEDKDGNVIVSFAPKTRQVLKPETAYILTDMMRDVIEYGTGAVAREYITFPAAGKTGTTQGYTDGWFIGYTPQLVAGVWVGFDDARITLSGADGQGARTALPIWTAFMQGVYNDNSLSMNAHDFEMPSGVVRAGLCTQSKMRATRHCPADIDEVMFENQLPKECDQHQSFLRSIRTFLSKIFN